MFIFATKVDKSLKPHEILSIQENVASVTITFSACNFFCVWIAGLYNILYASSHSVRHALTITHLPTEGFKIQSLKICLLPT